MQGYIFRKLLLLALVLGSLSIARADAVLDYVDNLKAIDSGGNHSRNPSYSKDLFNLLTSRHVEAWLIEYDWGTTYSRARQWRGSLVVYRASNGTLWAKDATSQPPHGRWVDGKTPTDWVVGFYPRDYFIHVVTVEHNAVSGVPLLTP